LLWKNNVAYRTENGALYGRPNGMPAVSVCSNQAFKN
jgi:hypothetical protein